MCIKVETKEISKIFELIINKLNKDNVEFVEIEEDLYWLISANNWDVSVENPDLGVRSLIDDWESLIKCKNENEIISYLEFDRIASILHAISEKLAPI